MMRSKRTLGIGYPNLCVLREFVGISDLLTLVYLRTKVDSLTVGLPVEPVGRLFAEKFANTP